MAGRHRSIGALRSWLWAGRQAQQVTTGRPAAIEMVDARTLAAHLVADEAVAVGRQRGKGRYFALCGVEVLAASLTEPPQRPCHSCAPIPSQRSRSNR
ncbi:MAG: hypothetical protein ACRDSZ_25180 [Pseudonocardiaceae bacterium]